jgi:membrane-associated phospholipid phosphatase
MPNISWKSRWSNPSYRKKCTFLLIISVLLLIAMPYGFDFIESRGGIKWNDPILDILPRADLSMPIFIVMYSLALLILYRVIQNPQLLFQFLQVYILITILRFILIYLIPLDPPIGMVELRDPITKIFYGGKIITRDLFFSGHTSTMFLIFLILQKRNDKIFALAVTLFIGISLLIQHVHYTADVIAAFPITWGIWKYSTKNDQ